MMGAQQSIDRATIEGITNGIKEIIMSKYEYHSHGITVTLSIYDASYPFWDNMKSPEVPEGGAVITLTPSVYGGSYGSPDKSGYCIDSLRSSDFYVSFGHTSSTTNQGASPWISSECVEEIKSTFGCHFFYEKFDGKWYAITKDASDKPLPKLECENDKIVLAGEPQRDGDGEKVNSDQSTALSLS
ncbi:MAG: hypothetical protein ABW189_03295 [Rickettsiales bacterium]